MFDPWLVELRGRSMDEVEEILELLLLPKLLLEGILEKESSNKASVPKV